MNRTIAIFFVALASCVTSFAEQPAATGKPSIVSGDPSLLPDQEIGRRFLVPADDFRRLKRPPSPRAALSCCPMQGRCRTCPTDLR